MKRHEIHFQSTPFRSPMSYWVHRAIAAKDFDGYWWEAPQHDPPLPKPVAGRGYARFMIECEGVQLEFASLAEIRECIRVLEMRNMPRVIDLAEGRQGLNSHWLSRIPAKILSWRRRLRVVAYLKLSLADFERQAVS